MTNIGKIAQLRQLLLGMERDLGVDSLGAVQKNIVYAATLLSQAAKSVETDEIRKHELLDGVSRSTFFRALKDVVEAGYLSHVEGKKRASYRLTGKLK